MGKSVANQGKTAQDEKNSQDGRNRGNHYARRDSAPDEFIIKYIAQFH
jgi:hypothetical protein